jgi:hypothetical protein
MLAAWLAGTDFLAKQARDPYSLLISLSCVNRADASHEFLEADSER